MPRRLLVLVALSACREPNPAFVGDDDASTGAPSTSTSAAATTAEDSTTGGDPDTTTSSADTHDPDTSSASADGDSGSTGAPPSDPYPACDPRADPPCPREFPECLAVGGLNWCAQPCDVDEDCPPPSSGDPEVVCAGPDGHQCALDCADEQTCPDGMTCEEIVNNIYRCVWST
ncbi:MAG TPA: hypothetical protein VFG69_08165 [Nannocystaceae bacterium]|nr:hypothetical protein [Nannocystaceae bacterium]